MPIKSLGYVRWQTPELSEWEQFATDILGLMPTPGPRADARYFRIDDRPYRLVLVPGKERRIDALGFEVGDDFELRQLVDQLRVAGYAVTEGSSVEADERLVGGFANFLDPSGVCIELYFGPILNHERVSTPLVSRFVTEGMGMGHVVLAVDRPVETVQLFRELLGFQLRNTGRLHVAGRPERTVISFLGCNPRHHTIGVVGMDIPGNLLHVMFEVGTMDDVGHTLDRCLDADVPLAMSLGKHTNDQMVSFYCVSPDKLQVEFGWGGVHIDQPDVETTYEISKISFWGHRRAVAG